MRNIIKIIFKLVTVIPLVAFVFLLCMFPLNIFTWFVVFGGFMKILMFPCYWMLQWDNSEIEPSWNYTGKRKTDILLDATLMIWFPLYVGYLWLFDENELDKLNQRI